MKLLHSLLILLAVTSTAGAETRTGASFLKINPVAETAALGDSGSAVVHDASSLFMNPAGIGLSFNRQLIAAHSQLFLDTSYNSFGYVHPLSSEMGSCGTLGISAIYLARGGIDGRDESGNTAGSFSASDLAVGLSYGRQMNSFASLGLSVKGLQQRIGAYSANGLAVDAGLQTKTPLKRLMAGISINNLGTGMKFISERDALPTTAGIGLGYSLSHVLLTLDAKQPIQGGKSNIGIGMELVPSSILTLRTGYLATMGSNVSGDSSNQDRLSRFAGFGAGIGLRLGRYQLDYAMVPHAELGESQLFSLAVTFP